MIGLTTYKNISNILSKLGKSTLWIPILADNSYHYTKNTISSLYVYSLDTSEEYMIGITSNELDNFALSYVMDNIPSGIRFAYNAKYLNVEGYNFLDVDMYTWYFHNECIEIPTAKSLIFSIYKRKYPDLENVHDVIPIMKIVEYCTSIREYFMRLYNASNEDISMDGYIAYEKTYRGVLMRLESVGMHIDLVKFNSQYNRTNRSPIIYGEYNPYTLTSRPSYKVEGVNILSMNKRDGSRNIITSRYQNGRLFEFDYDSYHVRLIADLIEYELPDGNVHEYFAKEYFGVYEVDEHHYELAKKITFSQLYGAIKDEYLHIDFFKKVHEYIEALWTRYNVDGHFKSYMHGRKFQSEWYDNMNKTKMFNYIIQSYETELNMMTLTTILDYLYPRKSQLILYNYDAIVIDYHPDDGMNVMNEVKRLMSRDVYPISTKIGLSYGELVDVTLQ